jgi:hypothetical protein
MRKIEALMNKAILNRKDWSLDNTRVEYEEGNEISRVYLHGHKIAEIGEGYIHLDHCGWKTTTTKSRINAILRENGTGDESVYQKNHTWFIAYDGKIEEFDSAVTLR